MKEIFSPRDLNQDEIRQTLWYYLNENPQTIFDLVRETGLSQRTIQEFMDPEIKRRYGIGTLLTFHKFLRTKFKERDEQHQKALKS